MRLPSKSDSTISILLPRLTNLNKPGLPVIARTFFIGQFDNLLFTNYELAGGDTCAPGQFVVASAKVLLFFELCKYGGYFFNSRYGIRSIYGSAKVAESPTNHLLITY